MDVVGLFSIVRIGVVDEESKEALKEYLMNTKKELAERGFQILRASISRRDEIVWDDKGDDDEDEEIIDNLENEVEELEDWLINNPR